MFYNCLGRLFPTSAFRLSCTSPLSIDDFRTVVLLPELAVHLIMDDLGQDRTTAVDTLLASINYGNFQFPLDLDDERACNQMIRNAFRNVHASASTCDSQAIYRGGKEDAVRVKKRALRSMLPAILNAVEGGSEG